MAMSQFNGICGSINDLAFLSPAKSRSLSPENPDGRVGGGARCELKDGYARNAARDLGKGWKVNPYVIVKPGETYTMADVDGPGCIQHIWLTLSQPWRSAILRAWWDDEQNPSIEAPMGDFFACGWGEYAQVSSSAVCVNPGSAFNCYWQMPFRKHCRMTLENRGTTDMYLYYQIDYILTAIPDNAAYFHAQFRRSNPLKYKAVHTILDGVQGPGHYVGVYIAWGVNNCGWWGEGEIKFYIDDDDEYPTICGTGTEDYFCGSYNFENQTTHKYQPFTTPYSGLPQVIVPDGVYKSQQRFGLYRWHITDPIRFSEKLRVTIQALGWRSGGRYLPLMDDISSTAFWYQLPAAGVYPALPDNDGLEII